MHVKHNSVYLASAATGSAGVKVLSLCDPAPKQNTLISSTHKSAAMQHTHNPKVSNISDCLVINLAELLSC
jgi:hypothetical protein